MSGLFKKPFVKVWRGTHTHTIHKGGHVLFRKNWRLCIENVLYGETKFVREHDFICELNENGIGETYKTVLSEQLANSLSNIGTRIRASGNYV